MKTTRLLGAVAACALALGCVRRLPCPAAAGRPWLELRSAHFALYTDLPTGEARATLVDLGRMHQAFAALGAGAPPSGPLDVVIFAGAEDYRAVAPENARAHFLLRDLDERPTIVMHGRLDQRARWTFQHELTHRFIAATMPSAPRWLHEGLARLYETVRLEGEVLVVGEPSPCRGLYRAESVLLGNVNPGLCRTEWIAFSTLPPVGELLRADPSAFQDPKSAGRLYAAAWLLVHRLVMDGANLQRRFLGYLARLSSGAGHESAWRESFSDIGPEELDRKIRAYALRREVPVRRILHRPRPAAAPSGERVLADAEVHLLWASLLPWQRAGAEAARQVAEALRQAPRSAEAHYWSGQLLVHQGRFREAERALRKALELRPDEPRTLWALAWAIAQDRRRGGDLRDVERLVRRLEERAPSPHALNFVAWYWGRAGRPDRGLSVARRALQAAPSCWRCAETMAALFFAKGRPREALALQRRALKMLPPHVSASQPLRRLRRYERVAEMREKKHR